MRRPKQAVKVDPPCYFNTGCCSFPDGDVTGLEIAEGEIRLVRWPGNLDELHPAGGPLEVHRRILARQDLEANFAAVYDRAETAPVVEEHAVRPA